jgi:hypothetical protein
MSQTLIGSFVCDRQGKMWAEVEYQGITGTLSTRKPYAMTLDKQDWIGNLAIDERQQKEISYLELGGFSYEGPGADSIPLLSCAPGNVPSYAGKIERRQGMAVASQEHLNGIVGGVLAQRNLRYPRVDLGLSGDYRNLDIAPQEQVGLIAHILGLPGLVEISSGAIPRGINWNNKPFIINEMGWTYNAAKGLFLPRISLEEMVAGNTGEAIPIPEIPPGGGFAGPGDPSEPPMLPPLPTLPQIYNGAKIWMYLTGVGDTPTVLSSSEIFDVGNMWTAGSLYFKIPTTGFYLRTFAFRLYLRGPIEGMGYSFTAVGNVRTTIFYRNGLIDSSPYYLKSEMDTRWRYVGDVTRGFGDWDLVHAGTVNHVFFFYAGAVVRVLPDSIGYSLEAANPAETMGTDVVIHPDWYITSSIAKC